MLGYGVVARRYPSEFPRQLAQAGYLTATVGKDHFGWENGLHNNSGGKLYAHNYSRWSIYDGILAEEDTYRLWFNRTWPSYGHGQKQPQDCWPNLDMNSWTGEVKSCHMPLSLSGRCPHPKPFPTLPGLSM